MCTPCTQDTTVPNPFAKGLVRSRACVSSAWTLTHLPARHVVTCKIMDNNIIASIQTTTVGSYPVPDWLTAAPSRQARLDATRVVFDIQRQAGIDLPTDGELYRFDINHPDTNGMIEYFVRPMAGMQTLGRADATLFRMNGGLPQPARGQRRRAARRRRLNLLADYATAARWPADPSSSPSPAPTCWPGSCSTSTTATSTR